MNKLTPEQKIESARKRREYKRRYQLERRSGEPRRSCLCKYLNCSGWGICYDCQKRGVGNGPQVQAHGYPAIARPDYYNWGKRSAKNPPRVRDLVREQAEANVGFEPGPAVD